MNKQTIEKIIVSTPGAFSFNLNRPFQPTPNFFSPIYIDIKKLVTDPENRKIITKSLANSIPADTDYICGLESGGSYFASAIADILNLPLILLRKETKNYGDINKIIGVAPEKQNKITIIDDVLAKGITLSKSLNYLRANGYQNLCFISIYSYGIDSYISQKLHIEIQSLSKFENLLTICLRKKLLTSEDADILKKHVSGFPLLLDQSQFKLLT